MFGGLIKVLLHRPGIGLRQDERYTRIPCRTDSAKHVGAFVTLIDGLTGDAYHASPIVAHSRSSGRCASRLGTRFQSELCARRLLAPFRACSGIFFKAGNGAVLLFGMLWPSGDMGEA